MKKHLTTILILSILALLNSRLYPQAIQSGISNEKLSEYTKTLFQLKKIVEANGAFEKSVFLVEELYQKSDMNYDDFERKVSALAEFVTEGLQRKKIKKYNQPDSVNYLKNYALFSSLFDTLKLSANDTSNFVPYSYKHEDPLGKKDWSNMFVTKLLATGKGNCHSLTYLYKIIADKIGAKCWLALAPNHIYIKNFSQYIGWYNTELTSRSFPTDAWIMVTSYVHPDAIRSGLYMDTLTNQQSIALCVLDLAKGYESQTQNYYDGFILECCEFVLQYHAVNPMALLLKAETLRKTYDLQLKEKNAGAASTYQKMKAAYARLVKLFYREMPEKMYLKWLENARNFPNNAIK